MTYVRITSPRTYFLVVDTLGKSTIIDHKLSSHGDNGIGFAGALLEQNEAYIGTEHASKHTANTIRAFIFKLKLKFTDSRGTTMAVTATDPIKIIFAILLPPLGVFLEVGLKGHFWLNILLTLLGFIPGIIHALYVILKH